MKLNELAITYTFLSQMEFDLPMSTTDIGFDQPKYSEYENDKHLAILQYILKSNINFSAMLNLNIASESGKEFDIDNLDDEQTAIKDIINSYLKYAFYKAISKAQNGLVVSFGSIDIWLTESLMDFVRKVNDFGEDTTELKSVSDEADD